MSIAKSASEKKLLPHRNGRFTAVDLFSGCGSVTEGLKNSGFNVIAAVDMDPVACSTYRSNHHETRLFEDDIKNVDPSSILELLPDKKCLDLLVVCAPCQPFSSQNRFKHSTDQRRNLILESVRFVKELNPAIVMYENVAGLAGDRFKGILKDLEKKLIRCGYSLSGPIRVDAADYEVPQRRERCLMFAGRNDFISPSSIHIRKAGKRKTVHDAFKGLNVLKSGERDETDPMHFARKHKKIAIERLSFIPKDGGSRSSLPAFLELDCHRGKNCYPDVYGRMKWDEAAPTLTTGCTDITRGRFAHPEENRSITLREAARLQTFPDKYKFSGSFGQIATQIGNAVPMKLVEAVAPAIIDSLNRKATSSFNHG